MTEWVVSAGAARLRLRVDVALPALVTSALDAFRPGAVLERSDAVPFDLSFGTPVDEGRELFHGDELEGRFRELPGGLAFWDGDFTVALRLALARLFPPPRWIQSHAAALRYPGGCVVALGVSGAGKSTLSTHAGGELLSDELVLLDTERREAFGLPVRSSSPRLPAPLSGAVRAFVTLRHASTHALRPLPAAQLCAELLASQAATPFSRLADQLDASVRLAESVPGYELSFAPNGGVGSLLEELCRS